MTTGYGHFETITRTVEVSSVHKKIIEGGSAPLRGEFAKVTIRLEPLSRGTGIQFVNGAPPGSVPEEMIGGVEEGIREAAKSGVLEGHPVVDFKATLLNGAYHEVDSNWHTFSLAAQSAFWDGQRKAGPRLLR
jgi:elongation factor G